MTTTPGEPTAVQYDPMVGPLMDDLLACVADRLAVTPSGAVSTVLLAPGQDVVADYCGAVSRGGRCSSQAWVRLVRVYPSSDFPVQDAVPRGGCPPLWAAELEVGVLRCVPVVKKDRSGSPGSPPAPADQTNATIGQLADMRALVLATQCCAAMSPRTTLLGQYLPLTSGDCGGGTLNVTTAVRWRA